MSSFRSLRFRMLAPIVSCALLAAVAVAIGSYWLGARWATTQMEQRLQGMRRMLTRVSFPLNDTVLESISDLSQTELLAFGDDGRLLHGTITPQADELRRARELLTGVTGRERDATTVILPVGGKRFQASAFTTIETPSSTNRVATVVVLFDRELLEASRRRAALLPLLTGLSTIVALASIILVLTSRLIQRIGRLRQHVVVVAAGDFDARVSDRVADEVGALGDAVDRMATQLRALWNTVNRVQSQKLLHQVAGGMAHQLRNSLTGARMAIELHAADCDQADHEDIRVAIRQLETSEDYVRRLLLVASGKQSTDRPADVQICCLDVASTLAPLARHRHVALCWNIDDRLDGYHVGDGATWTAALSNLVDNALQAGDRVQVDVWLLDRQTVRVRVTDNGAGIDPAVTADLFEPFVTSRPEGLGLGLAVVKRAADSMGGSVQWFRHATSTVFEFQTQVSAAATRPQLSSVAG